jgi:hypothetical protein
VYTNFKDEKRDSNAVETLMFKRDFGVIAGGGFEVKNDFAYESA